jgi:hypothetical protein
MASHIMTIKVTPEAKAKALRDAARNSKVKGSLTPTQRRMLARKPARPSVCSRPQPRALPDVVGPVSLRP